MRRTFNVLWEEYDSNGWCPGCSQCEPFGSDGPSYAHMIWDLFPWWWNLITQSGGNAPAEG